MTGGRITFARCVWEWVKKRYIWQNLNMVRKGGPYRFLFLRCEIKINVAIKVRFLISIGIILNTSIKAKIRDLIFHRLFCYEPCISFRSHTLSMIAVFGLLAPLTAKWHHWFYIPWHHRYLYWLQFTNPNPPPLRLRSYLMCGPLLLRS